MAGRALRGRAKVGAVDSSLTEWITLQEATELLGLSSPVDLVREIGLAYNAVMFNEPDLSKWHNTIVEEMNHGRIPARMIAGHDYLFTATLGSGRLVHPVSHVFREAVLPWAASRTVNLILADKPLRCPVHGRVDPDEVVWHPTPQGTPIGPETTASCGVRVPALGQRCGRLLVRR